MNGIEREILDNNLMSHTIEMLTDPNTMNNELLSEMLKSYLIHKIEPTFEIYVILQIISKLDININNKYLITSISNIMENNVLINAHNMTEKLIKNPFLESERVIRPFNRIYENNVVNDKK